MTKIYQLIEIELEDLSEFVVREVSRTRMVSDDKRAIDAAIESALLQGAEITDLRLHCWGNGRVTTVDPKDMITNHTDPEQEQIQEVIDSLMKRADSAAELADQKTDPTDAARCRGKAMAYNHAAELVAELLKD